MAHVEFEYQLATDPSRSRRRDAPPARLNPATEMTSRDAPPARLIGVRDVTSGARDAAVPRLYAGKYRIASARLQCYDYASAGMYFVTINALHHQCVFGQIAHGAISLSPLGQFIEHCWNDIPDHFSHIELDAFQIMPNHMHGILLFMRDGEGAGTLPAKGREPGALQKGSLSVVINSFKGAVTYESRQQRWAQTVWQPRFHEHVIRDFNEMARIQEYIITNPLQWEADRYYTP